MAIATSGSKLGSGAAARRLRISVQYLGELARAGRIPFEDSPYGRIYSLVDVERFREERDRGRAGQDAA